MRSLLARLTLACAAALASPAAAWETRQGGGSVLIRHTDGPLMLELACRRGGPPGRLGFRITGIPVAGTRGVLLWIALPDGRMANHSVDLEPAPGGGMQGLLLVSDTVLAQFQQGRTLEVAVNGDRPRFTTDLRGSGAARLAIREQCGF